MKKRSICWMILLAMMMTLLPRQAFAASLSNEAEIYTSYLLEEGYEAIMDPLPKKKNVGVSSCLIDIDRDAVKEALVQLTDYGSLGPRGYQTWSVLLDLEDGDVVQKALRYYGGGTMGGVYLYLNYDTENEKYVIVSDSTIRDAIYAGNRTFQVLSGSSDTPVRELLYGYYLLDGDRNDYDKQINQVKQETSLYCIEDSYLKYYKRDGAFISKAQYEEEMARYISPDDSHPYYMREGTYNEPIWVKKVPSWYDFKEDSFSFGNEGVRTIGKHYFKTMFEEGPGKLLYKEYKHLADGGICFGMAYTTAAIHRDAPSLTGFFDEKLIGDPETYNNLRQLEQKSRFYISDVKLRLSDLIKYNHIYQLSSAVAAGCEATWDDVDGLVKKVQGYLEGDWVGVAIGLKNNQESGGHMVLAVGIDGNDILIDDSNNTSDYERLTINEDNSWSYSGSWTDAGVNSDNSSLCYLTDVTAPYMIISGATGPYFTDLAPDNETYVEGMPCVDADRVLLCVDSQDYSIGNKVLPVNYYGDSTGESDSDLYWVENGNTVQLSGLSGEESNVFLAGDDMILGAGTGGTGSVTMTVSQDYTGLVLKSTAGERCSVSFETTAGTGEDIVLTVTGNSDGTVTAARTDSGISVSGVTDADVIIAVDGQELERQRIHPDQGGSVLVDYDDDSADTQMQVSHSSQQVNPFVDVTQKHWFYDQVLWAVDEGITNGLTDTTFGPDEKCTRNQVVTFLWRAAGSPEPENEYNPFVDVKESDYFHKAVLWAVEKGITTGMDQTHFEPNDPCTRGQVVTFLRRFSGNPEPGQTANPFTDVNPGQWFYDQVLWAVEQGITTGVTDTTFDPDGTCTRAQIVTFLYRAMN